MPHAKGDVPGPRHAEQSLPPARSFVVQFTAASPLMTQPFTGRIEHIESGRSQRFASSDELLAFFRSVLAPPAGVDR